jgi:hypothetical protein
VEREGTRTIFTHQSSTGPEICRKGKEAGLPISRVVLCRERDFDESFLTRHFGDRVRVLESPMPTKAEADSGKGDGVVPKPESRVGDSLYHLVAGAIHDQGQTAFGAKKQIFRWVYVRAPSVSALQLELEAVANFSAQPGARILAARLELLMSSTAPKKCLKVSCGDFKLAEEPISPVTAEAMHDGCGYVPAELLSRWLGPTVGGRAVAVQVRVVAPRLGVFKGVLMLKRGIHCVQLTPSMRKVLPSTVDDAQEYAWLIIKQV